MASLIEETQRFDETVNQNAETVVVDSTDSKILKQKSNDIDRMSNYCLRLFKSTIPAKLLPNSKNDENRKKFFTFPLSIGMNKIGRSEANQICILNKNVSKNHACIELNVNENGQLDSCFIWDAGSRNNSRVNNQLINGVSGVRHKLELRDLIQFGPVKFYFDEMSEEERSEQDSNRCHLVVDTSLSEQTNGHANGKASSLFEIQNTLDDTVSMAENGNGELKNGDEAGLNGDQRGERANYKLYIADTDEEDDTEVNGDGQANNKSINDSKNTSMDFHLELSHSVHSSMNYSALSNRDNRESTSVVITETMMDEDENDLDARRADKKESNAANLYDERLFVKPNPVIVPSDTLPVNEENSVPDKNTEEMSPNSPTIIRKVSENIEADITEAAEAAEANKTKTTSITEINKIHIEENDQLTIKEKKNEQNIEQIADDAEIITATQTFYEEEIHQKIDIDSQPSTITSELASQQVAEEVSNSYYKLAVNNSIIPDTQSESIEKNKTASQASATDKTSVIITEEAIMETETDQKAENSEKTESKISSIVTKEPTTEDTVASEVITSTKPSVVEEESIIINDEETAPANLTLTSSKHMSMILNATAEVVKPSTPKVTPKSSGRRKTAPPVVTIPELAASEQINEDAVVESTLLDTSTASGGNSASQKSTPMIDYIKTVVAEQQIDDKEETPALSRATKKEYSFQQQKQVTPTSPTVVSRKPSRRSLLNENQQQPQTVASTEETAVTETATGVVVDSVSTSAEAQVTTPITEEEHLQQPKAKIRRGRGAAGAKQQEETPAKEAPATTATAAEPVVEEAEGALPVAIKRATRGARATKVAEEPVENLVVVETEQATQQPAKRGRRAASGSKQSSAADESASNLDVSTASISAANISTTGTLKRGRGRAAAAVAVVEHTVAASVEEETAVEQDSATALPPQPVKSQRGRRAVTAKETATEETPVKVESQQQQKQQQANDISLNTTTEPVNAPPRRGRHPASASKVNGTADDQDQIAELPSVAAAAPVAAPTTASTLGRRSSLRIRQAPPTAAVVSLPPVAPARQKRGAGVTASTVTTEKSTPAATVAAAEEEMIEEPQRRDQVEETHVKKVRRSANASSNEETTDNSDEITNVKKPRHRRSKLEIAAAEAAAAENEKINSPPSSTATNGVKRRKSMMTYTKPLPPSSVPVESATTETATSSSSAAAATEATLGKRIALRDRDRRKTVAIGAIPVPAPPVQVAATTSRGRGRGKEAEDQETKVTAAKSPVRKRKSNNNMPAPAEQVSTAQKIAEAYSYEDEADESATPAKSKVVRKKRKSETTAAAGKEEETKAVAVTPKSDAEEKKKLNNKRKSKSSANTSLVKEGGDDSFSKDLREAQDANAAAASTTTQTTTPKIFFQSKQRNKTPVSSSATGSPFAPRRSVSVAASTGTPTPKRVTIASNLPTLSSSLANTSGYYASPSKKFKLMTSKSSSSENVNNAFSSSSDEDEEQAEKRKPAEIEKIKKRKEESGVSLNRSHMVASSSAAANASKAKRLSLQNTSTNTKTSSRSTVARQGKSIGSYSNPVIMTTGILLSEKELQIIKNLGGETTSDVNECTHLITNKIRKTYKFLSCIGRSVHIVNERWIEESNRGKMFQNPCSFALIDAAGEKQYKFSLQSSLSKSKSALLLSGWKFWLKYVQKPGEEISTNELKIIVQCNGGEVIEKLPAKKDELAKCCVIYTDFEQYKKEPSTSSTENMLKMTSDALFNSILRQQFDSHHQITSEEGACE